MLGSIEQIPSRTAGISTIRDDLASRRGYSLLSCNEIVEAGGDEANQISNWRNCNHTICPKEREKDGEECQKLWFYIFCAYSPENGYSLSRQFLDSMSRESYDPVSLQRRPPTTKCSSSLGPFRSALRKIEYQQAGRRYHVRDQSRLTSGLRAHRSGDMSHFQP